MNFEIIPTPHLPIGKVCHLLCGSIAKELQDSLLQYVDSLIITEREPKVEPSLQSHADIAACPLPGEKIIISKEQLFLKEKLISLGFYVIMQDDVRSPYPNDCLLNFINTQHYSIYNKEIHKYALFQQNDKCLSTKQGYVKCSVAPIAHNAILTDDPGIAGAAEQNNVQVCFVAKGDIRLSGYDYGFIGGCCGKLSEHELAFCGNLESHRDHKKIAAFLNRYDIKPINLLDAQLTDVGSLIPLTQEKG
ncbi:MAG: hypothetical protein E7523_03710 [Ruminococcaceae bacterium]|nr:hypothetical protein [Oscillospiraceae bacterium]